MGTRLTARLITTVLTTTVLIGAGTVAEATPSGAPSGAPSARERAAVVAARVDRLTAEYRRHSSASAPAVAALAAAYAKVVATDGAATEHANRLAQARTARAGRALTLYAYGVAARPELALLTADTPDDGLWRLAVGTPLGERLLTSATRDEHAARDAAAATAVTADEAARAAAELARALGALREEEDAARQALDTAKAELNRLDAEARREEVAQAAASRLERAGSDAATARRASSTPVTAIGIPTEFERAYRAAAPTCPGMPWTLLAAVGQIESGHGRNNGPSSAGAIGPMQFMPATFAAYGVDGDGDGRLDAWDPQDAVFSAAHYLCVSGAGKGPAGIRRALFAYNHAQWYVDLVLAAQRAIAG